MGGSAAATVFLLSEAGYAGGMLPLTRGGGDGAEGEEDDFRQRSR